MRKLGEDITETLEVIPRQWKVIQHVREKFTCRDCEKISQAPAPFHVIARGWAGPSLLAMSTISSALNTTGSFCGSRAATMRSNASVQAKKRSAHTTWLICDHDRCCAIG